MIGEWEGTPTFCDDLVRHLLGQVSVGEHRLEVGQQALVPLVLGSEERRVGNDLGWHTTVQATWVRLPVVAEDQEVSVLGHELHDLGELGGLCGGLHVCETPIHHCMYVCMYVTSVTPLLTMALLMELTRSSRENTLSESTCASEDTRCSVFRESWHTLRTWLIVRSHHHVYVYVYRVGQWAS